MKDYTAKIQRIRKEVTEDITTIMQRHKGMTANFIDNCGNMPVLRDDSDEESIYTLDRLCLNDDEIIVFEGSNSYSNMDFCADWLTVETLIDTLEELERAEDSLFEEEEDTEEEDTAEDIYCCGCKFHSMYGEDCPHLNSTAMQVFGYCGHKKTE